MSQNSSIFRQFRRHASSAMVGLLAACGGKDAKPADGAAPGAKTLKVALLTPGPVSDQAWNGGAYNGLLALRDSLGAQISHIQTKTPAEFEENFRQYGAQGYDLVIGHGFEFGDAALKVAPEFPKSIYMVTTRPISGANVTGVTFAFDEGAYQAGIIAGATTRTNTVGVIGGTEIPTVKSGFLAFEAGAKSVNPKVQVLTSYVGNWDDVSAGKEQALAQIGRGADVIFQNADAAGLGIFQAAREKKVLVFGANANQNGVAPDVVLASVVIDLPKAFLVVGRAVQQGNFTGHVFAFGVKDDVIRLVINPALAAKIPATALAASDSAAAKMRAGTFHALDTPAPR
jgi:basic membrane lipoprotein Med (substrate-binding protein (PBP1-ABC) superfamily)